MAKRRKREPQTEATRSKNASQTQNVKGQSGTRISKNGGEIMKVHMKRIPEEERRRIFETMPNSVPK